MKSIKINNHRSSIVDRAFEDANGANTTASGQETAEEPQRQWQTTAALDSMEVETPVKTAEPRVG
jgi:hypothetical protein